MAERLYLAQEASWGPRNKDAHMGWRGRFSPAELNKRADGDAAAVAEPAELRQLPRAPAKPKGRYRNPKVGYMAVHVYVPRKS